MGEKNKNIFSMFFDNTKESLIFVISLFCFYLIFSNWNYIEKFFDTLFK